MEDFIKTFYRKIGNTYFSTYDLTVIGFALSDARAQDEDQIKKSYELFTNDRKSWIKEYAWSDIEYEKPQHISWIRPFMSNESKQ